jgi:hypothetical protein
LPSTSFVLINAVSAGVSTFFAMLILEKANIRTPICTQWPGLSQYS